MFLTRLFVDRPTLVTVLLSLVLLAGTVAACLASIAHPRRLALSLAALFGVSVDPPGSHQKFIEKHSLPFPLLSDESHAMVEAYGVWIEKSMYGKKYMGAERSTFVIGPDGKIRAILRKVKPEEHAAQLLALLE